MAREKNLINVEIPVEWTNRQTESRFYEESVKVAVAASARDALAKGATVSRISEAFGVNSKTIADWLDIYPNTNRKRAEPVPDPVRESAVADASGIVIPEEWKNAKGESRPWRNAKGEDIIRTDYSEEVKMAVSKACHQARANGVTKRELAETFCAAALNWMERYPPNTKGAPPTYSRASTRLDDVMIRVGEDGYKYLDVKHIPSLEALLENRGQPRVIINFPDGMKIEGMSKDDLLDFLELN